MNKLIAYCSGGLGNRLRSIPSCLQLAQQSNRELLIFWEGDYRCQSNFNDLFKNELSFISEEQLRKFNSYTIYCSKWDSIHVEDAFGFSILKDLINIHGNASVGAEAMDLNDKKECVIIISNTFLRNTDLNINKQWIRDLKPIDFIQEKINLVSMKLKLDKNITGVHARGSDFNTDINEYIYRMNLILDTKPWTKFFVCSDDRDFEIKLCGKYHPKVLLNTDKLYADQYKPDKKTWINNTRMSKEAMIDSVVDLNLLAKTDFQVFNGHSSFAHLVRILQGE